MHTVKNKEKSDVQFSIENPSQNYGASPAVWDHTVLAATRHRWTRFTLILVKQLPIPEKWKVKLT